ncbi:helix-turn-helix domain-containing protein [Gilvibacter sp.]|uniref:helix-turn-helix domain-containing protein n=1 Tax=Gilvibacter sp. TaxID=2729997 RepID=UPI003F4A6977
MSIYQQHLENYKAKKFANQGQLDTIMAVKHHIDDHYQEELNLDVLSTEGFVSKFHMLRLFKKYHGQTPSQYLTDKRLAVAKELLKTGASVTETCYAVGFKSLGSFSALFKRRNNISPKEFQKRATLKK